MPLPKLKSFWGFESELQQTQCRFITFIRFRWGRHVNAVDRVYDALKTEHSTTAYITCSSYVCCDTVTLTVHMHSCVVCGYDTLVYSDVHCFDRWLTSNRTDMSVKCLHISNNGSTAQRCNAMVNHSQFIATRAGFKAPTSECMHTSDWNPWKTLDAWKPGHFAKPGFRNCRPGLEFL